MKIALVRQKYTPFGGAERYMERLVEGLCAAGHDVHIVASRWDAPDSRVTLHQVPVLSWSSWLKALSFAWNSRRILQKLGFDVVFSLERTLCQDVYRAGDGCHRQWLIQKNLGKGWPGRLANIINPLHITYLYLEKKLFTDIRLQAIIANSDMVRDDIIRHYGVAAKKIKVVHNGIAPDTYDMAQRNACRDSLAGEHRIVDELRLLYVGSGFERKGVPAILRATARLERPVRLFIVGKGRYGVYRRLAARLGIADKVIFTGPVRDVERYYLGCDLFVFPTLYDPFSNATLEAMLCGLPVVTSAFNGAAELVENGRNGWVVADPLDIDALVAAINRLADTPSLNEAGKLARAAALGLSMEKNVQETLHIIENCKRG